MPIYDFGYRGYEGPIGSHWLRWLVIARQGVNLAMRRKLLRRLLFLSWTPMLYFAIAFFMIGSVTEIEPRPVDVPGLNEPGFWENLENDLRMPRTHQNFLFDIYGGQGNLVELRDQLQRNLDAARASGAPLGKLKSLETQIEYIAKYLAAMETLNKLNAGVRHRDKSMLRHASTFLGLRQRQQLALRFVYDSATVRSAAWTTCFYYYVTRVQILVMVFAVMIVAPPLVANDLRGKSFLIYFSSAITKRDYIIGKLAVLMAVIAMVTILPGIALYALSIAFSPSIGVFADTFHVLLRMMLLIVVIGVPASLGAMYLSSCTTHPRFAAFSWIAVWVMGLIFCGAIRLTTSDQSRLGDWAFLLSPYQWMTILTEWVFGARSQLEAVGANHILTDRLPAPGFALVGFLAAIGLCALATMGILRRINRPMSV